MPCHPFHLRLRARNRKCSRAQRSVQRATCNICCEHGLMAETDESGKLTKAYGFHPDAQANGLWSTNPVWQADVKNGKLKDQETVWHYLHTDNLGTPFMATNKVPPGNRCCGCE